MRFEEDVPLDEAVLRCQLLKGQIINFVHDQSLPVSAVQLYAERELEEKINSFFDSAIYRIVRGYDEASRRATRIKSRSSLRPLDDLTKSV